MLYLVGIVAGNFVVAGFYGGLLACFIVCVWLFQKRIFLVGVVFFCLGIVRFLMGVGWESGEIHDFDGDIEFEGKIVEEVDVRDDKVKYTVLALEYGGRVLVNSEKYPLYEYGDTVLVRGEIERPGVIDSFDYRKYLARFGIYSVVYDGSLELVDNGGRSFFGELFEMKKMVEGRLFEVFPEPYGSFMAGLLLGSRRGIPEGLMEKFNKIGVTHIIAISGYNISIVVVVISGIFGFLRRQYRVAVSVIFVVLFTLFVGASAAVVRAAIMGVISLMALYLGRDYFVFRSYFAAIFLMTFINPLMLVFDLGFQLSCLATLGVIVLPKYLENISERIPDTFYIKETFLMTISAQVFTLPILFWNFGRVSLIAPIANLVILPFIPFAMLFGALGVVFGKSLGVLGYAVLKIVIFFVEVFAYIS